MGDQIQYQRMNHTITDGLNNGGLTIALPDGCNQMRKILMIKPISF